MDQERYGQLLAETRPGIIDTPEEHERLLGIAERLMEKADKLTEEEERLLALIVFVVEAYEASTDSEDEDEESGGQAARPHETLQRLMTARGLELGDIADIFGNPHIAREVLAGKRAITRGQAKELGRFFQAPVKIFLE